MEQRRLCEIALTFVTGMGSRSCRQLMEVCPSAEQLFAMSHAELTALFGNHAQTIASIESGAPLQRAREEVLFIERNGIKVLFFSDADYPRRLNHAECGDTPVVLYQLGDCDLNATKVVSIVGTRRATDYGKTMTHRLVEGLRDEGVLVTSGLAYGIDTAAHQASLDFGLSTAGVLGHGLDTIYPSQNRDLARRMAQQGGTLLTEYPGGTALSPHNFPARNRIIAAMSDAVVVVEAADKGGALITAGIAAGYHRDVFAVPGRLTDKYSAGCNNLIADNKATLIRNSDDLMFAMGWRRQGTPQSHQPTLFPTLSDEAHKVLTLIGDEAGMTLDEVVARTGSSMPKTAAVLLELELQNLVKCLPGKKYIRYDP